MAVRLRQRHSGASGHTRERLPSRGRVAGALPTTLYSILRELTVLLGGERRRPLGEVMERVESWPPEKRGERRQLTQLPGLHASFLLGEI